MTTDYDGFDPSEQVVAELRHLNPGLSETYASALACQVAEEHPAMFTGPPLYHAVGAVQTTLAAIIETPGDAGQLALRAQAILALARVLVMHRHAPTPQLDILAEET